MGVTMSPSRRTSSDTDPVHVHVVYEVIDGPDAAALQRAQATATGDLLAWVATQVSAADDGQPTALDKAA
jgi:hypothetical protein